MCEQIPFYEWAIAHVYTVATCFKRTFTPDICEGVLFFRLGVVLAGSDSSCEALPSNFVGFSPVGKFGRLDDHAREQLAKNVEERAFGLSFFNFISILGERCFEAVIDCLGQVVVELVEEPFLGLFTYIKVFNKCIGDIIGSHSIE